MSSKRVKLPDRRLSEVRKVSLEDGRKFYVTIGYDPKAVRRHIKWDIRAV